MTTPITPDRFVLDGSVTLAWLFQDEQDPYADAIITKLPHLEMLPPAVDLRSQTSSWSASRRKGCTQADTTNWLTFLAGLLAVAKRHRLEPSAYMYDVLLQLAVDASPEFLAGLLPDRWALAHPEPILDHRLDESRQKAKRRDERRRMRRLRPK